MSTRETIATGAAALDGTGDTFRSGGGKINRNLERIWLWAGGDSNVLSQYISFDSDEIVFEGTLADAFETRIRAVNPTADRSVLIPDESGVIVLDNSTQTLINKTLDGAVLTSPEINDDDLSHQYVIVGGALTSDVNLNLPGLSDSDTFVLENATQILTNKVLVGASLTAPDITTGLNDGAGATMIGFTSIGSAVNGFDVTNAAAASSPTFAATGTDTNIDMLLAAKGTGAVRLSKGAYQLETVTAAGAVPTNRTAIDVNSGVGIALTLADGTLSGEFKKFMNRGAGTATVTPSNFANGTSFALAQNEACEVIWNGSNWFVSGNQSVVTIT